MKLIIVAILSLVLAVSIAAQARTPKPPHCDYYATLHGRSNWPGTLERPFDMLTGLEFRTPTAKTMCMDVTAEDFKAVSVFYYPHF